VPPLAIRFEPNWISLWGGRLSCGARSYSSNQREFGTIRLDGWQSFRFLGSQAGRWACVSSWYTRAREICKEKIRIFTSSTHAGVSLHFDGCLLQVLAMYPIKQKYDRNTLPMSFDGRIEWRDTLQDVRDQGWYEFNCSIIPKCFYARYTNSWHFRCGASWAFSTAAVAADRLAIQSRGHEVYPLSMQNLLACNNRGQQGCNGGHLDRAWNYMRRFGYLCDNWPVWFTNEFNSLVL
jgi:hypothetical protein